MRTLDKFGRVLRTVDILTNPPHLRVNNSPAYKTIFGGIISLLIIMVGLLSSFYFGADLLFRNEPISTISDKDYDEVIVPVDEYGFKIFFGVEDKNAIYYNDPRVFSFKATLKEFQLQGSIIVVTARPVEIKVCSQYYDSTSFIELAQKALDPNMFYCIGPNQNLTITNYFGAPYHSGVYIEMSQCSNFTSNIQCLPQDKIETVITGGILSMYAANNLININNYTVPIKNTVDNIYYGTDPQFTYNLYINLKKLFISSDSGFVMKDLYEDTKFYFEDPHIIYYSGRNGVIANIIIQGKPMGKLISRVYIKIQDVLTNLGGIIEMFIIIGAFLSDFTSKLLFVNDFIFNLKVKSNGLTHLSIHNNAGKSANQARLDISDKSSFQDVIRNEPKKNNFIKSMTLTETNGLYPKTQILKDYFTQLFPNCKSKISSRNSRYSLEVRLNKLLSIDILLEKIFYLECLVCFLMNEEQQLNAMQLFLSDLQSDTIPASNDLFSRSVLSKLLIR